MGRAPRGAVEGAGARQPGTAGGAGRRRSCPAAASALRGTSPTSSPLFVRSFKLGGPGQDVYTAQCKHGLGGALIKRNRRKLLLPLEMPFSASAAGPGMGTGFGPLCLLRGCLRDEGGMVYWFLGLFWGFFGGAICIKICAEGLQLNARSLMLSSGGCRGHTRGVGGKENRKEGGQRHPLLLPPPKKNPF